MSSHLLNRSLAEDPDEVVKAEGITLTLADGREIIDACGGAAVISVGHNCKEVNDAMYEQASKVTYIHSSHFTSDAAQKLASLVVGLSNGALAKAYFVNSGSEATEGAQKLARQYFVEIGQPQRTEFISRNMSYHGNTLGSLALSGHKARRKLYEPILSTHYAKVSPCNYYRFGKESESEEEYVQRLAHELDEKFQEIGPDKVIAFVAEPVVGATTGSVPASPGYFKAMKAVCDKYGALLFLDEVMSGAGRTGKFFAYEHEGVTPDIVTMGKALGGGIPISAILMNQKVVDGLSKGSKSFVNGHTYQAHPVCCAAALKVQEIMIRDKVLDNVAKQGALMGQLMHEKLDDVPHVGNVRGRGLFWSVELVEDKDSKKPFETSLQVNQKVFERAFAKGLSIMGFAGTADGFKGDHVLLAPPYIVTEAETRKMVDLLVESIKETVAEL